MFEASDTQHSDPLPHAATRCLRACSCADHTTAEQLHVRSRDENGRSHKRRSARIHRRSALREADAAELAQAVR
jgi:hypothetical protein